MRTATLIISLAILMAALTGTAFAGKDAPADAKAALEEFVNYRGQGARAARKTFVLVDRIVAGGTPMLPLIKTALEPNSRDYHLAGYQVDPRACVISLYPNSRIALLEAAHRIGGEAAVKILMKEVKTRGDMARWMDRTAATLFLATRAGDPRIEDLFTEILTGALELKTDDRETVMLLKVIRGRLPESAFPVIAKALRAGWSQTGSAIEMAETLHALDADRAALLFLQILNDNNERPGPRRTAAWALARMPDKSDIALKIVLAARKTGLVYAFVDGSRYGRFGEIEMEADARESNDPEIQIDYTEGRIENLLRTIGHLETLQKAVSPEQAKALGVADHLTSSRSAIQQGEISIHRLKKQIEQNDKKDDPRKTPPKTANGAGGEDDAGPDNPDKKDD